VSHLEGQEAEVLAAIKSGQSSAFRKVYVDYFGMVRYLIINNSGTEDEAKDIFQEAMVVLYEKVNTGNFELTSSLKTWIYAVCRNKWLKQLEKKKKNYRFTDFEQFDAIEETEEETNSMHESLRTSMSRLGVGCRKILLLFYYFKKSMEEIATELNYTNADNAKAQKYKCIQKLKAIYAANALND
jgi:RNA polymerase sigma factor (sigma-70 family)